MSRDELLASFIGVDRPETSALLAGIAAIGTDDVEGRRIQRVLEERGHRLPLWLTNLGGVAPSGCVEMTHVLGDGDNVFVGVRWPTGEEMTAVVYIDHNLGTLVKDAFVVPVGLEEVIALYQERPTTRTRRGVT